MKQKKCKGTGSAIGTGCGNIDYIFRYGLCKKCFAKWLYSTEAGKKKLNKTFDKVYKNIEKEQKRKIREKKENIKTKSYFQKKLQSYINYIVRLIDYDKGCISCEHGWKKEWTRRENAGHRKAVGGSSNLRYNFHNIFKQCVLCNMYKSGNERDFDEGIKRCYGNEYFVMIEELNTKYPEIHLTIEEIKEKIEIAKAVIKEIKNGKDYTRNELNEIFKIYK